MRKQRLPRNQCRIELSTQNQNLDLLGSTCNWTELVHCRGNRCALQLRQAKVTAHEQLQVCSRSWTADNCMARHTSHHTFHILADTGWLEGAHLHTYIASEGDVGAAVGLAHDGHHSYLQYVQRHKKSAQQHTYTRTWAHTAYWQQSLCSVPTWACTYVLLKQFWLA